VTKKDSIKSVFVLVKELLEPKSSKLFLFLALNCIYRCANETLSCPSSIKRDASQNRQSAYIYEEMRPIYRLCAKDSFKINGKTATRQIRFFNLRSDLII
jgi:hypothetical protein